jgi:hypothetical protein
VRALCVVFASAAAAAALAPGTQADGTTVIRLISTFDHEQVVTDRVPRGVVSKGDVVVSFDRLANAARQFGQPTGARVGHDRGEFTFLSPSRMRIDGWTTLPGGRMHVYGPMRPIGGGVLATNVVGGTGTFAGASGTVTVTPYPNAERTLLAYRVRLGHASRATPKAVYGGLGSWLDIFAGRAWNDPGALVARAKAAGVRTLYLQTSNYSQRLAIVRPVALGRFVDAAHAAGMRVVAWYLPGFTDPSRDARRALAAVRFRSATGQSFDGFGLDIEASIVRNVTVRNARLLSLAALLRREAPRSFPLGAIIPSPVGMLRHPHYWPAFPYKALAPSFDAILPMAYFSHYAHSAPAAYAYAHHVMTMLRSHLDGRLPLVHMIGGSDSTIPAATLAGFVHAVSECGAEGVSLYAFPETSPADWAVLKTASLGGAAAASC